MIGDAGMAGNIHTWSGFQRQISARSIRANTVYARVCLRTMCVTAHRATQERIAKLVRDFMHLSLTGLIGSSNSDNHSSLTIIAAQIGSVSCLMDGKILFFTDSC